MPAEQIDIEDNVRTVEAQLNYLLPGPAINRRFVSAGVEVNTGRYGPFPMTIRDGRAIRAHFSFDRQGFQLLDAPTAVRDFSDTDEVDRLYPGEVERHVREAFGVDHVPVMGWMLRTSGNVASRQKKREGAYEHSKGVQPPAGEVHVDTEPGRQFAAAQRAYAKIRPDGPGFRRFIVASFWRAFAAAAGLPARAVRRAQCAG